MSLRPLFGLTPFWKQCPPGVTLPAERGGPGPLSRTSQLLRAGGWEGLLVPRSAIDAHSSHGAFVGLGRVRGVFALLLLHLPFPWLVPDRPTRCPRSPSSQTLCLSASRRPASLRPKATVASRLALCAPHVPQTWPKPPDPRAAPQEAVASHASLLPARAALSSRCTQGTPGPRTRSAQLWGGSQRFFLHWT